MKAIKSFILNPRQRWKRLGVILCVALIYVLPILTIPGLAAIYMKIEGVKGEVTARGYEGWIEVNSAQFGVARAVGTAAGGGADRESSQPSFSEFSITKQTDSTTPELFLAATVGEGKQVDIHFTRNILDQERTYYAVTLSDVLVSGFSQSSGGDIPSESLSLNFTKFKMTYSTLDSKGETVGSTSAGYDLSAGKQF